MAFSSYLSSGGFDDFLLRVDFSGELEWVQRGVFGSQFCLCFLLNFGGFEHSGVGGLSEAVDAGDFLFVAPFFFEFLGAQKVIVHLSQFAFAERVDERDDGGIVVAVVPKSSTHMAGVALLDMGVVVLVVGA